MKYFDKKKMVVLCSMLVMILCVSAVNHRLAVEDDLSVSAGYEEYEQGQLLAHDGEVLVDSVSVTALPGAGTSQGEGGESGENGEAGQGGIPDTADAAAEDTQPLESTVVTSDNVAELENADTYFEEMRSSVTMDRNEIISMLTEVIAELPEGAEKNNATQQKLKIIDYMNRENEMENLIENKGFAEALVIITDTSVNISVKKQELSQADVAKIMDIAIRETGRKAEEIVIQSKF